MIFKKFISLFFIFSIFLGFISCDAEKEDTNEVFTWEQTNVVSNTITPYDALNYTAVFNTTNLQIKGFPNLQDSIVINLGNLEGDELTVGTYEFGWSDFHNLTFFKNGNLLKAVSGFIKITYINRRIDFQFEATLSDGNKLTSGLGDNLNLYKTTGAIDITPPTDPGPTAVGTIDAKINGALFSWDDSQTSGYINTSTLVIGGTSAANTLLLYLHDINSEADIQSKVGQIINLTPTVGNITYVLNAGPVSYANSTATLKITEFKNKIITAEFSGNLVNNADPTDVIPLENGKVNALLLN